MSKQRKVTGKSAKILSILFFAIPFILFLFWMSVSWSGDATSETQKQILFSDKFPSWLSFTAIHLISLLCCILAISFASRSFRKKDLLWRIIMMVIVMLSIIIILFDISQLI